MSRIASFTELECWKACKSLSYSIMNLAKYSQLKNDKDLKWNILRAARSTTRNIAEGFGRHHYKENLQFCRISRGSLYEVWDDLITIHENQYINKEIFDENIMKVTTALKLLNGYIKYLNSRTQ